MSKAPRRVASGPFVCGDWARAREGPRRSAGDQFAVGVVAHHERVLADDLEAVARVEALRPVVFAPDADPQGSGSVALEPLERRLEEEGAAATALVPLQDVEALEFPVAGRDVRVGEVRGACGRVADRGLVSRVLEEEPCRPVGVLEF